MAASGDFRWPPMGRFPWPPSRDASVELINRWFRAKSTLAARVARYRFASRGVRTASGMA